MVRPAVAYCLLLVALFISEVNTNQHNGHCPEEKPNHVGTCGPHCESDENCPFGEKCCPNYCGNTCLKAIELCSERSKIPCCKHGVPYTRGGVQVDCWWGSPPNTCPQDYSCFVHELDWWAVCCPPEKVKPEPCSESSETPCCTRGVPYTKGGVQVDCGRDRTRKSCPQDYSCFVHEADWWAVCCRDKKVKPGFNGKPSKKSSKHGFHSKPSKKSSKHELCSISSETACCIRGVPYTKNGVEVYCGEGAPRNSCPEDYSCFVHEADGWAVCCRDKKVKPGFHGRPSKKSRKHGFYAKQSKNSSKHGFHGKPSKKFSNHGKKPASVRSESSDDSSEEVDGRFKGGESSDSSDSDSSDEEEVSSGSDSSANSSDDNNSNDSDSPSSEKGHTRKKRHDRK